MDFKALAVTHAKLLARVAPLTKSGGPRALALIHGLAHVDAKGIRGDIVECGVWQGGNVILARTLSPRRRVWLYDTFMGMPEPGPLDVTRSGRTVPAGKSAVSRETVIDNLRTHGVWDENRIRIVPGMVEDTLQHSVPRAIALLRLDTDFYESTRVELEVLYPRLIPGGVLIIDDYGHWKGCRKAVDDYFGNRRPRLEQIDYTAIMTVKPAQV